MFQVLEKEQIRVGVVGNISACHADAPGSIPGHGGFLFLFFLIVGAVCLLKMHQLNDTLPEWLRGSPAK